MSIGVLLLCIVAFVILFTLTCVGLVRKDAEKIKKEDGHKLD